MATRKQKRASTGRRLKQLREDLFEVNRRVTNSLGLLMACEELQKQLPKPPPVHRSVAFKLREDGTIDTGSDKKE